MLKVCPLPYHRHGNTCEHTYKVYGAHYRYDHDIPVRKTSFFGRDAAADHFGRTDVPEKDNRPYQTANTSDNCRSGGTKHPLIKKHNHSRHNPYDELRFRQGDGIAFAFHKRVDGINRQRC